MGPRGNTDSIVGGGISKKGDDLWVHVTEAGVYRAF